MIGAPKPTHLPSTFGPRLWDESQLRWLIDEFIPIYDERPIRANDGGMRFPHMFAVWVICRELMPQVIIESGIWKGQSTWLFEKACPNAELHCIDPHLHRRTYISKRATYYSDDFCRLDWSRVPKDKSLVFFDDHQDACSRVIHCYWLGFQHLVFEDNYPVGYGDCRSLKQVFESSLPVLDGNTSSQSWARRLGGFMGLQRNNSFVPHCSSESLRERLTSYHEFPPLFQLAHTRWGTRWEGDAFPTPEPVFDEADRHSFPFLWEEAEHYTWLAYLRLRAR